jgi:hypothetical protein
MKWFERILFKCFLLFRPRAPRPAGKEPSAAEIAATIVEFLRAADRLNGEWGKGALARFIKDHPLGSAGKSPFGEVGLGSAGRISLRFEPRARPLAPDFTFDFVEDSQGSISFSVSGDSRYEGFQLFGTLTPKAVAEARDLRSNWPTPPLNVSLWAAAYGPSLTYPVTRHAKRLKNVFMSDYGATDYSSMSTRGPF